MTDEQDLAGAVREVIDTNQYMVLGTADEGGQPWVSPVYYAAKDYTEFYWISSPEVTHSRNLARRPRLSIVVFDSQQPAGTGRAVYMSAEAEQLAGADVEQGLMVYPGHLGPGVRRFTPEEVRSPGPYRLYRATVSRHWMLCPRSPGKPCTSHGRSFDHRTTVALPGMGRDAEP